MVAQEARQREVHQRGGALRWRRPKEPGGNQGRGRADRHGRRSRPFPLLVTALLGAFVLSGCAGLRPEAAAPSAEYPLPTDDQDVVGEVKVIYARHEDTLAELARQHGLGFEEMVAANPGVDPWLPGKGTRLTLPTQHVLPDAPRKGLVLNLAALRLFYFPPQEEDGPRSVITYPVGIGREGWRTPQGTFRVTEKREKPVWRVPASIRREHAKRGDPLPAVVPAGPRNPLGEYAMRLSLPKYLIHGTDKPYGVGMRVSHGCVRLYPEDIAELFPNVPVGTEVRILNQPYLAGWRDGRLYLEAHEPLAEDKSRWQGSLAPMKRAVHRKAADHPDAVDWERAVAVARDARGVPASVALVGSPAGGGGAPEPRPSSRPPGRR